MINHKYDQTIGTNFFFIETSNDIGAYLTVEFSQPTKFDDPSL